MKDTELTKGPAATQGAMDECECTVLHAEAVERARLALPPLPTVEQTAAIFQALGDPTRVRILHALGTEELCVCDLAVVLDMTQSAVSHQLRTLRNLRIVKRRKVGRVVYYSLDDLHIRTLLETGLHHASHE